MSQVILTTPAFPFTFDTGSTYHLQKVIYPRSFSTNMEFTCDIFRSLTKLAFRSCGGDYKVEMKGSLQFLKVLNMAKIQR